MRFVYVVLSAIGGLTGVFVIGVSSVETMHLWDGPALILSLPFFIIFYNVVYNRLQNKQAFGVSFSNIGKFINRQAPWMITALLFLMIVLLLNDSLVERYHFRIIDHYLDSISDNLIDIEHALPN